MSQKREKPPSESGTGALHNNLCQSHLFVTHLGLFTGSSTHWKAYPTCVIAKLTPRNLALWLTVRTCKLCDYLRTVCFWQSSPFNSDFLGRTVAFFLNECQLGKRWSVKSGSLTSYVKVYADFHKSRVVLVMSHGQKCSIFHA